MPIERFDDVGLAPVITYPRDAVVERRHVAAALNIGDDAVAQLDLPSFGVGKRERFLWGMVLDTLAERALPSAPEIHRRGKRAS